MQSVFLGSESKFLTEIFILTHFLIKLSMKIIRLVFLLIRLKLLRSYCFFLHEASYMKQSKDTLWPKKASKYN